MFFCITCGTQATTPELCSGCGSLMTSAGQPPKSHRYEFVLIAHLLKGGIECIGPFPSIISADQWWDSKARSRKRYGWKDYEVVLMENPADPREVS